MTTYVLTLIQEKGDVLWASFDSLQSGREFLAQLSGYHCEKDEKSGVILREWLLPTEFPDYAEITFRGNRFPVSKFMFEDFYETEFYFQEIPDLSTADQGFIDGVMVVDAYAIPHAEIKNYIETREKGFCMVQKILAELDYDSKRAFHGSEDGEAIMYRRRNKKKWHFLAHMDPLFVDVAEQGEAALKKWVKKCLPRKDK